MGNCQAIDAATMVIQHPGGRVERLYWPMIASEVMRMNPGHYVALIITMRQPEEEKRENDTVRITRVKVLRPTDTLVLGQAYRLITSEEVMKGLWAKKYAKMKRNEMESKDGLQRASERERSGCETESRTSELENNQGEKHERNRPRTATAHSASARSKAWRPSLQSISEAGS